MFESASAVGAGELDRLAASLCRLDTSVDDPGRVDQIRALERLKAAAAAAQAEVLVGELPQTYAALRQGETTEWRAMLVARQTEAEAKRIAYWLDPHGYLARTRGAESGRRVTVRPAPDVMRRLTGFLPVAQAVAAYASLKQHADSLISQGDARSRGQIMADTLVERVTGQVIASAVPVTVNLVMTDRALFNRRGAGDGRDGADEPAHLDGYGPVPADLARRLVADAPAGTKVWLRRLFTAPDTGALVATDSRSRCFDHGLREFLVLRDQTCRTPWCNAPIRHADHATPAADGGPTSADNGQGLCEACDYAKQAPGWRVRAGPGGAGDTVVVTTPTGHRYTSRPPDPPGYRRREAAARARVLRTPQGRSHAEEIYRRVLAAA